MQSGAPPILKTPGSWEDVLSLNKESPAARALGAYLRRQRWYRDKARTRATTLVVDVIPLAQEVRLLIIQIEFASGEPSCYCVPIAFGACEQAPAMTIAEVHAAEARGFLTDATNRSEVPDALFQAIVGSRRLSGMSLEVVGLREPILRGAPRYASSEWRLLAAEQSNTCYVMGDKFILKLLRKVETGQSQEVEILRHLTAAQFAHAPRLLGHLELHGQAKPASSLGILQEFVEHRADAFLLSVQAAESFYEKATTWGGAPPSPQTTILELRDVAPPSQLEAILGDFVPSLALLGQRVAELHVALAASNQPEFLREPLDATSQRALSESLAELAERAFQGIRASHGEFRREDRELALAVLRDQAALRLKLREICNSPVVGTRIRVHGDLHLGQVLSTGRDFVILDFEGEPARSPAQRCAKRSPMADVAGMLRSLAYAAHAGAMPEGMDFIRAADSDLRSRLTEVWQKWAGAWFLRGYLQSMAGTELLPPDREQLQRLLDVHLLEKTLYETVYELENRPAWIGIPLGALRSLSR